MYYAVLPLNQTQLSILHFCPIYLEIPSVLRINKSIWQSQSLQGPVFLNFYQVKIGTFKKVSGSTLARKVIAWQYLKERVDRSYGGANWWLCTVLLPEYQNSTISLLFATDCKSMIIYFKIRFYPELWLSWVSKLWSKAFESYIFFCF